MTIFLSDHYKLRLANQLDQKDIKDLIFNILEEYNLPVNEESGPDVDLNNIELHYSYKTGSPFWVIVNQVGETVGTVALHRENTDTCELRKMYLLPNVRGLGLGKAVMEYVIAEAKELGYKSITLETDKVLKEAVQLYKKFGFVSYNNPAICDRCDTAMKLEII